MPPAILRRLSRLRLGRFYPANFDRDGRLRETAPVPIAVIIPTDLYSGTPMRSMPTRMPTAGNTPRSIATATAAASAPIKTTNKAKRKLDYDALEELDRDFANKKI